MSRLGTCTCRQSLGQVHVRLIIKLVAVLVLTCLAWPCTCIVVPPVKNAGMAVILLLELEPIFEHQWGEPS